MEYMGNMRPEENGAPAEASPRFLLPSHGPRTERCMIPAMLWMNSASMRAWIT